MNKDFAIIIILKNRKLSIFQKRLFKEVLENMKKLFFHLWTKCATGTIPFIKNLKIKFLTSFKHQINITFVLLFWKVSSSINHSFG